MLDSDTDGEWSFSMATPTIQRGSQKGPSLVVSSADERTSTMDTSDDSLPSLRTGGARGSAVSCEKLRNKVVLQKGAKVRLCNLHRLTVGTHSVLCRH